MVLSIIHWTSYTTKVKLTVRYSSNSYKNSRVNKVQLQKKINGAELGSGPDMVGSDFMQRPSWRHTLGNTCFSSLLVLTLVMVMDVALYLASVLFVWLLVVRWNQWCWDDRFWDIKSCSLLFCRGIWFFFFFTFLLVFSLSITRLSSHRLVTLDLWCVPYTFCILGSSTHNGLLLNNPCSSTATGHSRHAVE